MNRIIDVGNVRLLFLYARLWRRPSVCLSLVGRTVSSRILQLCTFDQQDQNKAPIVFQDQRLRSYCHIVRKWCRQNREWTIRSRITQLGEIDHHDERKTLNDFQGRRSNLKVALSQSRKTWQHTLLAGYKLNLVQLITMLRGRYLLLCYARGQGHSST